MVYYCKVCNNYVIKYYFVLLSKSILSNNYTFLTLYAGLYDTVFDVDHDKERAQSQGLVPNGFNFEGADAAGVDYAVNR